MDRCLEKGKGNGGTPPRVAKAGMRSEKNKKKKSGQGKKCFDLKEKRGQGSLKINKRLGRGGETS